MPTTTATPDQPGQVPKPRPALADPAATAPTEPIPVPVPESPVTVYGFRFDPDDHPIGALLAAETALAVTS